jgi:hypothetical protein
MGWEIMPLQGRRKVAHRGIHLQLRKGPGFGYLNMGCSHPRGEGGLCSMIEFIGSSQHTQPLDLLGEGDVAHAGQR